MDFSHTEDRRMLADSLERFIRDAYPFDGRLRQDQPAQAERALWQRLAGLGAVAALFDEDAGGMGGSGFDVMVVFEALGRGLVIAPAAGALMAGRVLAHSDDPAARVLLEQVLAGAKIVLLAYEEDDTGGDPARVAARARQVDAGWRLTGVKRALPQAELADAYIVAMRSSGAPGDERGISLFIVPADAPGLALRSYPLIDGGRGADLLLDGVVVADEARLCTERTSFPALAEAVGCGLLALAAESLGAMEFVQAATVDYLRTRQQFGVPIGSFQALQHRMVDLLIEIEQARSAVINAADKLDAEPALRERALSAAKFTVGRVGTLVAEESIQLHGGIGMTWELPLAHYAKRLVMIDHQLGDEDQHLARYIELGRSAPAAG